MSPMKQYFKANCNTELQPRTYLVCSQGILLQWCWRPVAKHLIDKPIGDFLVSIRRERA